MIGDGLADRATMPYRADSAQGKTQVKMHIEITWQPAVPAVQPAGNSPRRVVRGMPLHERLALACALIFLALAPLTRSAALPWAAAAAAMLAGVIVMSSIRLRSAGTSRPPIEIEITDTGIVTVSSGGYSEIPWTDVTRVDEWHGFWFGRTATDPAFVLPLDCLTPPQVDELRTFMVRRGLDAAAGAGARSQAS